MKKIVESSPEIMGGTPVFAWTRVPIQTLIDYIEAGDSINVFLDDFPTVPRELVIEAIEFAKEKLMATAE